MLRASKMIGMCDLMKIQTRIVFGYTMYRIRTQIIRQSKDTPTQSVQV